MKYDEYIEIVFWICSGIINLSINTVVQQRCKFIEEQWTKRVTVMLNVWAAFKDGKRPRRQLINLKIGHS